MPPLTSLLLFKRIFSYLDKSQARYKRFNDSSVTDGLRESDLAAEQLWVGWVGVRLAGSQVAYI